MKIGILGTGTVGLTIGTALINKGHQVMLGSRTANNEKAIAWTAQNGTAASNGTFEDAAKSASLIFLCLNGSAAVEVIQQAGISNFANKIVVDVTNPLNFSQGIPPSLLPQYSNTWSLGEEIQKQLPDAHVVKGLNTITANLMVNAQLVNDGNHHLFICGNDTSAKETVKEFLAENFNWKKDHILDLGNIKAARLTEAIVPFWVSVMQQQGTAMFNYLVVK